MSGASTALPQVTAPAGATAADNETAPAAPAATSPGYSARAAAATTAASLLIAALTFYLCGRSSTLLAARLGPPRQPPADLLKVTRLPLNRTDP